MKRLAPICALLALLAIPLLFLVPNDSKAQLPGTPSFSSNITRGLDVWRSGGDLAAIRTWLRDGPLEDDDAFRAQLRRDMQAIERALGKPQSSSMIRSYDLTGNTKLVYICVEHEDGPFFMRFLNFRRKGEWVIAEMKYNVEVDPLLTPLLGQ